MGGYLITQFPGDLGWGGGGGGASKVAGGGGAQHITTPITYWMFNATDLGHTGIHHSQTPLHPRSPNSAPFKLPHHAGRQALNLQ